MFPFYVSDALESISKARYKCLWMSHSTSGACGSLYGNHCSSADLFWLLPWLRFPKLWPTTQRHVLSSQTCSNATSVVVINHYTNWIGRIQSGLVHSPKGLRSTGLEVKSPGTPDRTLEKQNNCMDWSRTSTFPLLQPHPCTPRVFWVPAQCSSFPKSTSSAPESFTLCQDYLGALSFKSNTTSSSNASNSSVPPWGCPSAHRPSLIPSLHHPISPCCSHPLYTTHCPAELWVCAQKKWEFSSCVRQNNLKINLFRASTWGSPGMKHVKYIKCTINV